MPDHTPADKPDLPALAIITVGDKEVRQRWFTEKEVRRLLADERRKALEFAADLCERDGVLYTGLDMAPRIRALIPDTKE